MFVTHGTDGGANRVYRSRNFSAPGIHLGIGMS